MSDLSRLLDDVYRTPAARPDPAWSSDSALDEVFSNWIPGPPAQADATDPLDVLLEHAARATPEVEVRQPVVASPTLVPGWSRADDDILPAKAARRFTLRRR
jgi:hypothetical protein